jgi:hypothetical protein
MKKIVMVMAMGAFMSGVPIGAKWCSKHGVYDKCWTNAKTPGPRL